MEFRINQVLLCIYVYISTSGQHPYQHTGFHLSLLLQAYVVHDGNASRRMDEGNENLVYPPRGI
jgi:hypothetical protein